MSYTDEESEARVQVLHTELETRLDTSVAKVRARLNTPPEPCRCGDVACAGCVAGQTLALSGVWESLADLDRGMTAASEPDPANPFEYVTMWGATGRIVQTCDARDRIEKVKRMDAGQCHKVTGPARCAKERSRGGPRAAAGTKAKGVGMSVSNPLLEALAKIGIGRGDGRRYGRV